MASTPPTGAAPASRASANAAEVYGFVAWLASGIAYACYLLWAFLPERVLNSVHISYYPSKYWAVAAPAYACIALVLIILLYVGLNLVTTPALSSTATLADEHTRGLPAALTRGASVLATPEFADIPITAVNHVLFRDAPTRRAAGAAATNVATQATPGVGLVGDGVPRPRLGSAAGVCR